MPRINVQQFDYLKELDGTFRPTLKQLGSVMEEDENTYMTTGRFDTKLFYRLSCTREDLYKGDEGYIDVTLKIENNTADIDVKLHDFFDDYFEIEEDDEETAQSIDDVTWMFMQEPFIGGPIYAMARFKFQSKEELYKTLTDRMSCFSDPEFIKAMTLGH
jgi:hypothetical protein